ncbi:MAG TPA: iron-sulfur cluster repair di-iron protein [Pyrinomonadaceae bacterium]|nr:iron-sulfur cluster repair di-iron protein [Pyrinomonadaceae bacterium]
MLDPNMTVRELALQIPNGTRVLEQAKIDYCCGGNDLLRDACQSAGVDLELLEQMLATNSGGATAATIDFEQLTLNELITHILDTHHVFTRNEMARLEVLAAKVVAAHGENHSELLAISSLLRQLCDDLMQHMFKEEQILFPFIVKLEQSVRQNGPPPFAPFGTVNHPVRMMTMEHETAGEILRELRKLSSDYAVPPDACASYQALYQSLAALERDLHQHIHLENNVLFPQAIALEANPQASRHGTIRHAD